MLAGENKCEKVLKHYEAQLRAQLGQPIPQDIVQLWHF